MRYPPALIFVPQRSRVYGAVAILTAIILIAVHAISMWTIGYFSFKSSLFTISIAVVSLWLLSDAFSQPRGHLHYAQGQWQWLHADQETAGTCALHIDLQRYMLVSFKADHANNSFLRPTTQWFHLEARHVDQATWGKLRRAVYAQTEPAHEAVAV